MENTTQHRPTVGGPYSPHHDGHRTRQKPSAWERANAAAGILALIGTLLTTIVGYAVAQAKVDAKLDSKVDAVQFERVMGELRGDVRVIRAAVCAKSPEVCQ